MIGTVKVDFAGSRSEVLLFAKQHALEFPRTLTAGRSAEIDVNGNRALFASFRTVGELAKIRDSLEILGWEFESQVVTRHDGKRRG